jgi:hypothetical protein
MTLAVQRRQLAGALALAAEPHAPPAERPGRMSGDGSRWAFRLDVADIDRLDAMVAEPLPLGLRAAGTERHFHRDVYYDTPDGDLERRGVSCRVRVDLENGRLLTVKIREPERDHEPAERQSFSAPIAGDALQSFLTGDSDAARVLRTVVDPARLGPVVEMDTDRRLRQARWLWLRKTGYELAYDAVTVRAGDREETFAEIKVRRQAGMGRSLARLGRALSARPGTRPTVATRIRRARVLLRQNESRIPASVGATRRCAVLPFHFGLVGLRRQLDGLVAMSGPGSDEDACRAVLRDTFGTTQAQVRLLGASPASGTRPSMQVWMARRIPAAAGHGQGHDIVWASLERLAEIVGSAALRDPATLAALQIAARSDLMREQPVWEPLSNERRVEPAPQMRSAGAMAVPVANADLSLLAFHERVLAIAEDETQPLADRIRYLAIVGANLDEFFMVRVGALKRAIVEGRRPGPDGLRPRACQLLANNTCGARREPPMPQSG